MTKTCYRCHLEQTIDQFSKNASRPDGLSTQCKTCHKSMRKEHYNANKQKTIDKVQERREELRIWLQDIKKTLSCSICGFSHPAALDFHHRDPTSKEEGVTFLVHRGASKDTVQAEIEKCDVLCANCHRIYHYDERAELA